MCTFFSPFPQLYKTMSQKASLKNKKDPNSCQTEMSNKASECPMCLGSTLNEILLQESDLDNTDNNVCEIIHFIPLTTEST